MTSMPAKRTGFFSASAGRSSDEGGRDGGVEDLDSIQPSALIVTNSLAGAMPSGNAPSR